MSARALCIPLQPRPLYALAADLQGFKVRAMVYRQLRLFAFFEMLLFIVLVLCGFFYIWKKGVLNWSVDEQRRMQEGVRKHAA